MLYLYNIVIFNIIINIHLPFQQVIRSENNSILMNHLYDVTQNGNSTILMQYNNNNWN